ncbi:MAG: hypothetical protein RLO18_03110, partial [Gimesia chilikensis]
MALETLHGQGLLHNNLDNWSILTSASEEPDFQLTGFEWSMRLTSVDDARDKRANIRPRTNKFNSFREDWGNLGRIAADLVGAPRDKLSQFALAPSSVAEHLTALEVRALRKLISIEPLLRLDGEVVGLLIDEIMNDLASEAAGRDIKHHLVVRVGPGTHLSDEIRRVTDGDIEADDTEAQLEFVRNDLSDAPLLLAVRESRDTPDFRLVLQGHHLLYRLTDYRHPRHQQVASWEFAQTDSVDRRPPVATNLVGQFTLDPSSLEFLTTGNAAARYPLLRGRLVSWDELRTKFRSVEEHLTPESRFKRALSLTQMLEMAFAAADTFPVQILGVDP